MMKRYTAVLLAVVCLAMPASVSATKAMPKASPNGAKAAGGDTFLKRIQEGNRKAEERFRQGSTASAKVAFLISLLGDAADAYALTSAKGQEHQMAAGAGQLGALAEHHAMSRGNGFGIGLASLYNTLWRAPERMKRFQHTNELADVIANMSKKKFDKLMKHRNAMFVLLAVDALARMGFVFSNDPGVYSFSMLASFVFGWLRYRKSHIQWGELLKKAEGLKEDDDDQDDDHDDNNDEDDDDDE